MGLFAMRLNDRNVALCGSAARRLPTPYRPFHKVVHDPKSGQRTARAATVFARDQEQAMSNDRITLLPPLVITFCLIVARSMTPTFHLARKAGAKDFSS